MRAGGGSDDSRSVYLLKLPTFLHELLCTRAERGEGGGVVGAVRLEGPDLRFETRLDDPGDRPTSFVIKARPLERQQLKAFRDDSDGHLEMVGSVTFRGDVVPAPQQAAAYATMLDDRARRQEVKAATSAVVGEAPRTVEEKRQMYKRARAEREEERERAPVQHYELTLDQMMEQILNLFQQQPHWSKRDVMKLTDQKDSLVTQALHKLATVEVTGEHKGEYTLRTEYRLATAPKKSKK